MVCPEHSKNLLEVFKLHNWGFIALYISVWAYYYRIIKYGNTNCMDNYRALNLFYGERRVGRKPNRIADPWAKKPGQQIPIGCFDFASYFN